MKTIKVLLPLSGLLLVAAMVVQARYFSASAMGSLEAVKEHAKRLTGGSQAKASSPGDSVLRINAEGRVTTYPGAQVVIASDTAGTIMRLLVDEKSYVRKGDLLAEVRADDLRAAIAQARARVVESDADIKLYETEVHRAATLYESAVGTKQAVDRNRRDLEAATARRDTALADVQRLEAVLDKTVLRAPISGTVTVRYVQPGESVKEQAPIVGIADLSRMRIEAEVDEFDAGRVKLGSEVVVRAEGYDDQQWRGRVEEIPDSVVTRKLKPEDPGRPTDTRVLLVKVALLEKTPLKLGQRVEVEIKR